MPFAEHSEGIVIVSVVIAALAILIPDQTRQQLGIELLVLAIALLLTELLPSAMALRRTAEPRLWRSIRLWYSAQSRVWERMPKMAINSKPTEPTVAQAPTHQPRTPGSGFHHFSWVSSMNMRLAIKKHKAATT